jgi:periplasmic divalent cation tolerance protein
LSAVLILSTAPTRDEAGRIAEALVSERLAACVQLSPIESWYRWEDRIEQAAEVRLHIKTTAQLADRVDRRIRALHSYDVPEIMVLPVAAARPIISAGSSSRLGPKRNNFHRSATWGLASLKRSV